MTAMQKSQTPPVLDLSRKKVSIMKDYSGSLSIVDSSRDRACMSTILRRIEWLSERIEARSEESEACSHDRQERKALRWAMKKIMPGIKGKG
jgi:hypothetical protein